MYKCEICGFECASEKLMKQHRERHAAGLTESEQKRILKKHRQEYLLAKEKVEFLKEHGSRRD